MKLKPIPPPNDNAWREFRDCLNEPQWFLDKDGRREAQARTIVKHGLNAQYQQFAHAIAFRDCCETPGRSYVGSYENNKFTLRWWIREIRKEPRLNTLKPEPLEAL